MFSMFCWYASRYITERRRQRAMVQDNSPWTGRMVLAILLLAISVALWVVAPPM